MERNPWKLATIGLAVMGTTALGTGLTTAWIMRPPATAVAQEAPAVAPQASAVRYAVAPSAPRAITPAVARTAPPVTRTTSPAVTPVATTGAATTGAATDCSTGGERAMRIAKPGVVGALLGAGLGAAGGAIADGGKAAGKGALIGGIAGAALGGGYGAYKTQQECGTILGNGFTGSTPAYSASAPQAALGAGQGITVYNAR